MSCRQGISTKWGQKVTKEGEISRVWLWLCGGGGVCAQCKYGGRICDHVDLLHVKQSHTPLGKGNDALPKVSNCD